MNAHHACGWLIMRLPGRSSSFPTQVRCTVSTRRGRDTPAWKCGSVFRGLAKSVPQLGVRDESLHRNRQGLAVSPRDENSGFALDDHVGVTSGLSADHRFSSAHHLTDDGAERLRQ